MKRILIGLLAIGSVSSYAMTEFEQALSESSVLLRESRNYEAKHVNDDGSITIVRPKFSNPDGDGDMRLSGGGSSLNRDGVCKLFGAQSFVKYSARYEEVKGTLTRISSNGTFEKFDPSNEFNALKSLICLPSNPTLVEPSDNAEKILNNDDGSITIVRPKFSNPDGNGSMRLSGGESLFNRDGVCKLFGAHSFVLNSARYEEVISTLTRISSNGTFEKFDSGYKFDALKSLICIK